MINILIDNKTNQYFGDTTYKCIPPTFHKYKLFIISAYNFLKRNINICCFCLIPNELEITYQKVFETLKNIYKFNPIIFTLDFSKSISKAITNIFPHCIQIKCLFHYIQALVKKLNKLGLIKKEYFVKNTEIIFNIKALIFIEPSKIKKTYEMIESEYSDEEYYGKFFQYFRRQWKPFGKKAKIKFTPIWNHYDLFKNNDFDKSIFLTNNVSESINHILNSYFKTKYPTYNQWRNAIVEESEKVSIKAHEVDRKDYITKILLYLFKLFKISKKKFKIFKIDEIKKINSFIIPEHDSITMSSLSNL